MAAALLLKGSPPTMSYWITVQWAGPIARHGRSKIMM
jgi:hypothetical protein